MHLTLSQSNYPAQYINAPSGCRKHGMLVEDDRGSVRRFMEEAGQQ